MHKMVGAFFSVAVGGVMMIEQGRIGTALQKPDAEQAQVSKVSTEATGKKAVKRRYGRTAKAFRDRSGHFNFKAKLNGRKIDVLVDTGASSVAISESVARKIGLRVKRSDFKHRANTANGIVNYARATIREIRIQGITVRNVKAAVLPDRSLSDVLLGMSFLNKLESYNVKGRTLTLKK